MSEDEPVAIDPDSRLGGRLHVGLAADKTLRWAAVDMTLVVEEARRRHDLSPVASVALGRAAAAAVLLQRLATKQTSRMTVDIRGTGPLERVYAEVDDLGRFRGFVGNPLVETTTEREGEIVLSDAIGTGLLRVLREGPASSDGGSKNYESQVALVSGEIGTDVAHYLEQSEQRRSAVLLGVLLRPSGVAAAGGILVEALPGADNQTITAVERAVLTLGPLSRRLEDLGARGVVEVLLDGLEPRVVDEGLVVFACRCSREKMLASLSAMSAEEIESLLEDGQLTASCSYCNELHVLDGRELLGREITN
jgi:molecular chaperone Hsp33